MVQYLTRMRPGADRGDKFRAKLVCWQRYILLRSAIDYKVIQLCII